MSKPKSYERLLHWYPRDWRARYGEGFSALLEDSYAQDMSRRAQASIARAGLVERARETGLVGVPASSNDRLLSGSQLVLCGWSLFMVAGAMFAKCTEHWGVSIDSSHRTLASIGDRAVHWAGAAGMVLVLSAGLFVFPALLGLLRNAGWSRVRRSVLRSVSVLSLALLLTSAMTIWAQFLSNHQRNGGLAVYEVVFLLCSVALAAAIVTVTSTVISVTRQLELSRRTLLVLSNTALVVTFSMAMVTVGTVTWWASEAVYAPQFLSHNMGGGLFPSSNTLPPTLVLAGLLMVLGLWSALSGVRRLVPGLRTNITPALQRDDGH
jgi:chromate transport protein ChrA